MTTYTVTQTVTHALRRAGLLGDDETPSSEQLDLATKTYNSRVISLQTRGVNLWGYTSTAVPEEYLDPLASYVGLFLKESAGGPAATDPIVLASEATLRALSMIGPTYDVIEANHF